VKVDFEDCKEQKRAGGNDATDRIGVRYQLVDVENVLELCCMSWDFNWEKVD
jgi:type IV secretory pathway TrbF-like protein